MRGDGPEDIRRAVVLSATDPDVQDSVADFAEVLPDSLLDDGVVEAVPIVGSVAKLARAGKRVHDAMFVRKLSHFLRAPSRLSDAERASFRAKMLGDPAFMDRVGDGVILLLERQEHFEKCHVLGCAFAAFEKGEVDYALFQDLATVIDRSTLSDLRYIATLDPGGRIKDVTTGLGLVNVRAAKVSPQRAVSGVITTPNVHGGEATVFNGYVYQLNEAGEMLRALLQESEGAI